MVGISIDGPREIHDAYRVTKGGRGSFEQVMRGLGHLRDAGVEFNALTTLHAANAGRGGEVYRFLRDDCGARFIQFIPIIERVPEAALDGTVPWSSWRDRPLYEQSGEFVTGRSITGEQYGRFLIDVFEEWVRRDVGEVYVQMFDVALANWFGEPPGLCVHSETCGLALALEHTGDLYSCDHFVEPDYNLGNIAETPMIELVASRRQQAFRASEARHAAEAVPGVRRAFRLPRRLPQGPLHPHRRRRSRASTTCARATWRSSTTSTDRCGPCVIRLPRAAHPRRSSACMPPRTPSAAATTRARAAAAASGSSATALRT